MEWPEEVDVVLAEAAGDLALTVGLLALRRTEAGSPGREWGVLSVHAPTYDEQLRVAATTFRHREHDWREAGNRSRYPGTGLFTDGFLRYFSAAYAPVGAENDPKALNRNHCPNLLWWHARLGLPVLTAVRRALGTAGMSPTPPLPSGA